MDLKQSTNIGHFVYTTIRHQIMDLTLRPNDKISENDISVKLQVSRTPAREAMLRLSEEKLIDMIPYKGTYISRISFKAVDEGCFIRQTIEEAVIKIAIHCFQDKYLRLCQNILEEQQKLLSIPNSHKDFFHLDDEFHRAIFETCNRQETWNLIEKSSLHYQRMRLLTLEFLPKLPILYKEHCDLLEAIINKNEKLSIVFIRKHLEQIPIEKNKLQDQHLDFFTD